jgi:hypothetical protein
MPQQPQRLRQKTIPMRTWCVLPIRSDLPHTSTSTIAIACAFCFASRVAVWIPFASLSGGVPLLTNVFFPFSTPFGFSLHPFMMGFILTESRSLRLNNLMCYVSTVVVLLYLYLRSTRERQK